MQYSQYEAELVEYINRLSQIKEALDTQIYIIAILFEEDTFRVLTNGAFSFTIVASLVKLWAFYGPMNIVPMF